MSRPQMLRPPSTSTSRYVVYFLPQLFAYAHLFAWLREEPLSLSTFSPRIREVAHRLNDSVLS